MKVPKKISPDRISSAVVEVRYQSQIPHEIAVGMFFQGLDETYIYELVEAAPTAANGYQLKRQVTFTKGGLHITFGQFSIIFRVLNAYPGWEVFSKGIIEALTQMNATPVIEDYKRVGIRYLSEYPNMELSDIINYDFSKVKQVGTVNYNIGTEYKDGDYRVLLKFNNNAIYVNVPVPPIKEGQNESILKSTIDVDIIRDNMTDMNLASILSIIEEVHIKQKEVFFSILKEDFLATLTPVY